MLTVAFDESTMSRTQVPLWYNRFKEGRCRIFYAVRQIVSKLLHFEQKTFHGHRSADVDDEKKIHKLYSSAAHKTELFLM